MANIWALLNNLDGHCLAPPQLRHEFGTKTRQSAGAGRTTRSQADRTVNATLPRLPRRTSPVLRLGLPTWEAFYGYACSIIVSET